MQLLDDWDSVRIFLAIQRAGSLSGAAATLGVTQPTCGRRLSQLESALGTQLFTRAPDGLRMTPEGAALVVAATQMEEAARNVARKAAATIEKIDGVVRVAMTEFTALAFGARVLPVLRERYPAVRIELVLADGAADILGSETDLAIRWRPEGFRPSPGKVVARKLGRIGWCLFGSELYLAKRGTPRDPSDLTGHDVVLYPGGPHPGRDWLVKATEKATPVLISANLVCNAAAVSEGIGLGFFPQHIVRLQPSLRAITQPVAFARAWLVMHPDLQRVRRIRAVADLLAKAMSDDLRLG
jgi:DNA-binding transcriptional LysR family regulator